MKKAYLTRAQTDDLLEWIASAGEDYGKYLQWCDRNSIVPDNRYTEFYLPRWVQKHRRLVQAKREQHKEAVREASIFDRAARLRMLEAALARLESAALETSERPLPDFATLVKIEEQKRKTLESIAKERGEFGKAPEDSDEEIKATNRQLRSLFGGAEQARIAAARDVTAG